MMGYTEESLKAMRKAHLEKLIAARQALDAVIWDGSVSTADPDWRACVTAWEALRRLTGDALTAD